MEQLVKTNEYRFRWIWDVRFSVCSLQLFNSSKGRYKFETTYILFTFDNIRGRHSEFEQQINSLDEQYLEKYVDLSFFFKLTT